MIPLSWYLASRFPITWNFRNCTSLSRQFNYVVFSSSDFRAITQTDAQLSFTLKYTTSVRASRTWFPITLQKIFLTRIDELSTPTRHNRGATCRLCSAEELNFGLSSHDHTGRIDAHWVVGSRVGRFSVQSVRSQCTVNLLALDFHCSRIMCQISSIYRLNAVGDVRCTDVRFISTIRTAATA